VGGVGEDVGGGAADESVVDPAVSVGAEYDEVGGGFLGFFQDGVSRGAGGG